MAGDEDNTLHPKLEESIDPSNPLYIHPADLPAQHLVSTVFNGNGFSSWKRSMLIALSAKNKIGFIDGEVIKPTEESVKIRQWQRCNDMVISWILNSVSKDIGDSILYCETAKDMWAELMERFEQYNGAMLYQVQDQLNGISQGSDSISVYFTKLKKLWEELKNIWTMPVCKCGCTCNAYQNIVKHEENQKVIRFLMGLNETYNAVRGNILMMNPIPSINGVYSLLIQEEKQREISSVSSLNYDASAMTARGWGNQQHNSKTTRQQHGGNTNNYASNFKYTGNDSGNYVNRNANFRNNNLPFSGRRNNYFCTHCDMEGHSNERCYKLHPELRSNKKVAAMATISHDVGNLQLDKANCSNNTVNDMDLLSSPEYNQIMQTLNKTNLNPRDTYAMMTGPFHEQILGPW